MNGNRPLPNPLLPLVDYLERKAGSLSPREANFLSIGLRAGHMAEALARGDAERASVHAKALRELLVATPLRGAAPRERRLLIAGMLASHFEEALAQGRFDDARVRARELWPLVDGT